MVRSLTDLVDDLLAVQHVGTLYRRSLPVLRPQSCLDKKGQRKDCG
jgi:hypothetical protein